MKVLGASAKVSYANAQTQSSRNLINNSISLAAVINMAWEHGEPDFQSRFDKSTAQAEQMKNGALRVL